MIILKCLEIFLARIVDVSLGTVKTYLLVKGKTIEPFFIAFIEILVWYAVAREALNTEGNTILIALSYGAGYATGTLIGSKISKLIKGVVGVQIITKDNSLPLVENLRKKGYVISVIELKDTYEGKNKDMLYIQVNNKRLKELFKIVKKYDKDAFIVVNETKLVQNGMIK